MSAATADLPSACRSVPAAVYACSVLARRIALNARLNFGSASHFRSVSSGTADFLAAATIVGHRRSATMAASCRGVSSSPACGTAQALRAQPAKTRHNLPFTMPVSVARMKVG